MIGWLKKFSEEAGLCSSRQPVTYLFRQAGKAPQVLHLGTSTKKNLDACLPCVLMAGGSSWSVFVAQKRHGGEWGLISDCVCFWLWIFPHLHSIFVNFIMSLIQLLVDRPRCSFTNKFSYFFGTVTFWNTVMFFAIFGHCVSNALVTLGIGSHFRP